MICHVSPNRNTLLENQMNIYCVARPYINMSQLTMVIISCTESKYTLTILNNKTIIFYIMTNQRAILLLTFIVVVSFSTSFGGLIKSSQCLGDGVELTVDLAVAKPIVYFGARDKSVFGNISSGIIKIPYDDLTVGGIMTITHVHVDSDKLYVDIGRVITECFSKKVVDSTELAVSNSTITITGEREAIMTLNPPDINFDRMNTMTINVGKDYDKAIIRLCKIRDPRVNPPDWIPIHDCLETSDVKFVDKIVYNQSTGLITAELRPVSLVASVNIVIQCEFDGCVGNCTHYFETYKDGKCL